MSCDRCVGARRIFDDRVARSDLKRYRRRGPARTTRILLDALEAEGVEDGRVLDVGGGIGAIPNRLLEAGAREAVMVDASPAYLHAAAEEAARQGHADAMVFREGDFVSLAPALPRATIVTLDRVVCCYEDMPALVAASARAAERAYGLVYPRDTWWTRAGVRLANALVRFTGTGFRAFVHPTVRVEEAVRAQGLERVFQRDLMVWQVAVFRRVAPKPAPPPA